MEEVKGCQYILKSGPNKGKECCKPLKLSIFKYCLKHGGDKEAEEYKKKKLEKMFQKREEENKLEREKLIKSIAQNQRNITFVNFEKGINFHLNPTFDKNEKDLIKFVDQLLSCFLFFHPVQFTDRTRFYLHKEQVVNFTLKEVKKELELRGFVTMIRSPDQTFQEALLVSCPTAW